MQYFEERDGKLIFRYNGETVQVEAWGQDSLRVRSRVLGEISEECSALTEEVAVHDAVISIQGEASAEITNTWRVVGQTNKPDAVVFALAGGMSLTERVIQLFRSSLPDSMNVKLVPCDCAQLARTRDSDELFSQYRVLFVVSTEPLKVSLAPVVLLEDIIVTEDCVMAGIISELSDKSPDLADHICRVLHICEAVIIIKILPYTILNLPHRLISLFKTDSTVTK